MAVASSVCAATHVRAITLSTLQNDHLPIVGAIQQAIYPPFFYEDVSLVGARAAAYPAGHFIARLPGSDDIVAYASSYPWPLAAALEKPPSLGALDLSQICAGDAAPSDACYFLHEISVHAQGSGVGSALVNAMLDHAESRGFRVAVLVSVLGNDDYYAARWGFEVIRRLPSYAADGPADAPAQYALKPTPSHFLLDASATLMRLALPRARRSYTSRFRS